MSIPTLNIWGTPPTARYEQLAAPFRPLFARILAQAAEADQTRASLAAVIQQLSALGLPRWRLRPPSGGSCWSRFQLTSNWAAFPGTTAWLSPTSSSRSRTKTPPDDRVRRAIAAAGKGASWPLFFNVSS